jgi:hypothetical protein
LDYSQSSGDYQRGNTAGFLDEQLGINRVRTSSSLCDPRTDNALALRGPERIGHPGFQRPYITARTISRSPSGLLAKNSLTAAIAA